MYCSQVSTFCTWTPPTWPNEATPVPNMSAPCQRLSRYTNRHRALSLTIVYALDCSYRTAANSSKAYCTQARLVGQSATAVGSGQWAVGSEDNRDSAVSRSAFSSLPTTH